MSKRKMSLKAKLSQSWAEEGEDEDLDELALELEHGESHGARGDSSASSGNDDDDDDAPDDETFTQPAADPSPHQTAEAADRVVGSLADLLAAITGRGRGTEDSQRQPLQESAGRAPLRASGLFGPRAFLPGARGPPQPGHPAEPQVATPPLPEMNDAALQQLLEMGFPETRARNALLLSRMNVQLAMERLFEHEGDPAFDAPLSPAALARAAGPGALPRGLSFLSVGRGQQPLSPPPPPAPAPSAAERLRDMGFGAAAVDGALRTTGGDYEMALALLISGAAADDADDGEGGAGHDDAADGGADVLQRVLASPVVQSGLENPRVAAAMRQVMRDPSRARELEESDDAVAEVLAHVRSIIREGAPPGSQ